MCFKGTAAICPFAAALPPRNPETPVTIDTLEVLQGNLDTAKADLPFDRWRSSNRWQLLASVIQVQSY